MIHYVIKDIQHLNGETRQDGAYPARIGCTIAVEYPPEFGSRYIMDYIKDNQDNPKSGAIWTSRITDWRETHTGLMIKTLNSIYVLEETA